ncbi:MAG: ABC transporter permease [Bacteroidetes bacterium]|nr:MAG: ABC transporter permease [Bacteroidota bacterium]
MSKTFIIAQREFLSRVQKKTFLLTTILLPLIIFVFYGFIIYFSVNSSDTLHITVVDEGKVLPNKLENKDDIKLNWQTQGDAKLLKAEVAAKKIDAFVVLPKTNLPSDTVQLVSGKTLGLITRERLERMFNNALEEQRLLGLNVSKQQLDSIQTNNTVVFTSIDGKEDNDVKAGVSYAVGYISGFMIYLILFIYGSMVMRGVMEEKTNRIAEVIVSSTKPFELMMGKILGIGAVGLVQFTIWLVIGTTINLLLPLLFPGMNPADSQQATAALGAAQQAQQSGAVAGIMKGISTINFPLVIGCFFFYFLGGYFIYSALFAAVGSAVNDDPQDAQSLMLPITMPIIFAIVIMTKAVNDPNSSLAVFGSLFPLTSPIVMMGRIAHGVPDGVPYWQLILSMALLIAGFIGTTWVAGKIYRTGILMYGKKPTWKELIKWARKSD